MWVAEDGPDIFIVIAVLLNFKLYTNKDVGVFLPISAEPDLINEKEKPLELMWMWYLHLAMF